MVRATYQLQLFISTTPKVSSCSIFLSNLCQNSVWAPDAIYNIFQSFVVYWSGNFSFLLTWSYRKLIWNDRVAVFLHFTIHPRKNSHIKSILDALMRKSLFLVLFLKSTSSSDHPDMCAFINHIFVQHKSAYNNCIYFKSESWSWNLLVLFLVILEKVNLSSHDSFWPLKPLCS